MLAGLTAAGACSDEKEDDCRGPGVYQRGKEGGPSCCPDLNTYYRLVAYNRSTDGMASDGRVCDDPVGHAEFGCLEGTCGDGRCEVGEEGECACTVDCPVP